MKPTPKKHACIQQRVDINPNTFGSFNSILFFLIIQKIWKTLCIIKYEQCKLGKREGAQEMRMIGKEIFINRRVEFELCRLDFKKKKD